MAGFSIQDPRAPLQLLPPELLAQMAQGAFRPPQMMQTPQMAPPVEQAKFGIGEGMAGLGSVLNSLRKSDGTIVNAMPGVTAPAFGAGNSDWFAQNMVYDPLTNQWGPRR